MGFNSGFKGLRNKVQRYLWLHCSKAVRLAKNMYMLLFECKIGLIYIIFLNKFSSRYFFVPTHLWQVAYDVRSKDRLFLRVMFVTVVRFDISTTIGNS